MSIKITIEITDDQQLRISKDDRPIDLNPTDNGGLSKRTYTAKRCPECDDIFVPKGPAQKFCSDECKKKAKA